MNKRTKDLIKNIRNYLNLSQKEFAKKLFLTENKIKRLENYEKLPDIELLSSISDEFNIIIDFFLQEPPKDCKSKDIIIVMQNGKMALFDKSKSAYLTAQLYDEVLVSEVNYFIVYNYELLKEENDKSIERKIIYSAIVDCNGNIKSFSDIEFNEKSYFNFCETCVAKNISDGNIYLTDIDGNLISKGYNFINNVNSTLLADDSRLFGLYYAKKLYNPIKDWGKKIDTRTKLLSCLGEEIVCTFSNPVEYNYSDIKELSDINLVCNWIEKYGPNVVTLVPSEVMEKTESYVKIVLSCADFIKKHKKYSLKTILYITEILKKFADYYKPKRNEILDYKTLEPDLLILDSVEKEIAKNAIKNLYVKLKIY